MNRQNIYIVFILFTLVILISACNVTPPPVTLPPSPTELPATAIPPTSLPNPTEIPATPIPIPTPTTIPPTNPPTGTSTLKLLNQVKGEFVGAFGWSPDNRVLTAQVQDAVIQYNAASLQVMNNISTTFAAQVFALSPDGARIVGVASDQSIQVWNASDGKSVTTLQGATLPIGAIFTPDGKSVATFSADQIEITLWDAQTGAKGKTLSGFQTAAPVYSAVFASDNKMLAWVSRGTVQFQEIETGKLGAQLQFEDFVGASAFTPDSQSFVTLSSITVNNQPAGAVQVWNVADGKMQQQLTGAQFFTGLSISPTGTLLATADDTSILLWDWKIGGDATKTASGGQVATLKFSNDGKMLATGDQDSKIAVWGVQ